MSTKGRIITALWFFLLVSFLDRVAISFAGPSMMKSLSMAPATYGIVLSSFGIGYLLAQIPGGLLADKWGAKAPLVIGPLFWALFTGATGLIATVGGLVIARVCFGISEGIPATAVHKAIGDNFDSKQRARALAICSTAIPLAPAFAGALVGNLIGAYGWRAMFLMMTGPGLLAAVISYWLLPLGRARFSARGDLPPNEEIPFRRVLSHAGLWILSASNLAFSIGYWGYQGWMPAYLALGRHIRLNTLGPLASVPYVFAFFGMLIGGWLGSGVLHRYRPQLAAFGYLATGLSLFLAFQAGTTALSLAGLSGAAFFLYATQGPVGAIWLDLAPDQYRARYIGIINTCGHIGGAIAPGIIGFMVGATGAFGGGFAFMIVALCIAAGCMIVLQRFLAPRPLRLASI